ncbi:MAG: hypothetical protein H7338_09845 [Candidatus Sericytochromatia bacterium]|nr:hypothetical protein [Candidatus Sericytochromatia bacterium]
MPNTPSLTPLTTLSSHDLLAALANGQLQGSLFGQKGEAVRNWGIKKGRLFCFLQKQQDRYLHVLDHETRNLVIAVDGLTVVEITWNARPAPGQVHFSIAP